MANGAPQTPKVWTAITVSEIAVTIKTPEIRDIAKAPPFAISFTAQS